MMLYNWNKFLLVELSCFGIEIFKTTSFNPGPSKFWHCGVLFWNCGALWRQWKCWIMSWV